MNSLGKANLPTQVGFLFLIIAGNGCISQFIWKQIFSRRLNANLPGWRNNLESRRQLEVRLLNCLELSCRRLRIGDRYPENGHISARILQHDLLICIYRQPFIVLLSKLFLFVTIGKKTQVWMMPPSYSSEYLGRLLKFKKRDKNIYTRTQSTKNSHKQRREQSILRALKEASIKTEYGGAAG